MAKRTKKLELSGRPQLSALSDKGHEIPDSTPHTASLKRRRASSIRDNVIDILRSEKWREAMEANGEETFEEADDFDVDDDFDPSTPYEEFFEGEYAYMREQRLEMQKTETQKARRGRKPAPRPEGAESKETKTPVEANSPGAGPSSKAGPARTSNSPGEAPSTS